jgi:hypothetical protein
MTRDAAKHRWKDVARRATRSSSVLREKGCQVAARTYRACRRQALTGPAARTVTDAQVANALRDLAWTIQEEQGRRKLTPEGLHGRRSNHPHAALAVRWLK